MTCSIDRVLSGAGWSYILLCWGRFLYAPWVKICRFSRKNLRGDFWEKVPNFGYYIKNQIFAHTTILQCEFWSNKVVTNDRGKGRKGLNYYLTRDLAKMSQLIFQLMLLTKKMHGQLLYRCRNVDSMDMKQHLRQSQYLNKNSLIWDFGSHIGLNKP